MPIDFLYLLTATYVCMNMSLFSFFCIINEKGNNKCIN